MKPPRTFHLTQWLVLLLILLVPRARAATYYVNQNNPSPAAPYTSWATAATNIQNALFFTANGDAVLVTNGIYQYDGVNYDGSNRVYAADAVVVQSVNGPAVTTIVGYQVPGTTNGDNAVRCVYLQGGATLSGFTLTNGATTQTFGMGGGVYCAAGATVTNCIITGNASYDGGPVYGGVVNNCVISSNVAVNCSGIEEVIANNCLIVGNGNTNSAGSAVDDCTLINCTVTGNSEKGLGAARGSTLYNSIIYGNNNGFYADCYSCKLTNCCTTIGPGASALDSTCFSNSPGFISPSTGNYHLYPWSHGIGAGKTAYASYSVDLDGNPRVLNGMVDMGCYENQSPLSGVAHYVSLTSTNPVAPYTNWMTAATNIAQAVAIAQAGEYVIANDGAYTNSAGTNVVTLTNTVTLVSAGGAPVAMIVGTFGMRCAYVGSNAVLMGFTLTNGYDEFNANGGGALCAAGGVVSNCDIIGNEANEGGAVYGGSVYNSVITNNNYENGVAAETALYNCIVISNGMFTGGNYGGGLYYGTASNCLIAGNRAYSGGGGVYHSVVYNSTIIGNYGSDLLGMGAYQSQLYGCSVLTNIGPAAYECLLSNCIVSGNGGNGTYLCTNYNCLISGNISSGYYGGGAYGGISYNCILTGNFAPNGGGTYNSTVYNCTIVSNTAAGAGGGVNGGSVYNSIIYYNSAASGSNDSGGSLHYCCTAPYAGQNCISSAPIFINLAGGDYHQQTNSPTINDGENVYDGSLAFPTNTVDFDGNPRIGGGVVDIGAYEYQGSNYNLPIPIQWLIQYGLPTDGSQDYASSDNSGMDNWQKWIAGLIPFDSASVLAMLTPAATNNANGITVTWQSVRNILYNLQRSTNLPAFTTIQPNITGQAGTTSYTDTSATNNLPYFYRVGVIAP